MKTLSLVILAGFIALSLFGFLGMLESSDMSHTPNKCLASLAQNGACPPSENTVASALFHTNAYKVFSTPLLSAMAVLMAFAFICAGFGFSLHAMIHGGGNALIRRIDGTISRYLALQKLKLALVRFEHSPTSL